MPDFARERFENWVMNAEDWNISRQRYWGIPIPLWKCECGEVKVVGSFEELRKGSSVGEDFDLHNASEVKLECKCGKLMERIDDIFDVWFDSGIAPWASLGYPFANKEEFDTHFPVSRVNESQDQIRGWFYSLMFCGAATFDKPPYEAVSMPGWVVDAKGNKMSKSLGNVTLAKDGIEELGADNLRFYYMWDVAPYELQKFNSESVKKEVFKVLNVLWNLHAYLRDNYCEGEYELKVEDRWVLSRLNSLLKSYDENLEKFEYHQAMRGLSDFVVNQFSREYIQFVRERVDRKDKAVSFVLKEVVVNLVKMLAPVTPFISDKIFLELRKDFKFEGESVHLCDWPKFDEKMIDLELENAMVYVRPMMQEILFKREKEGLSVRWPLPCVKISCDDADKVKVLEDVIKKQVNVKKIVVGDGEYNVELDVNLSDDLKREGYARELIRRIQMLRKKKKLKKADKVNLILVTDYDFKDWIGDVKDKVNAFEILDKGDVEEEFEIKSQKFGIGLKLL